ncbi:MAG: hypothetical protein PHE27_01505 [Alphaproteobacteria bacterium]|nr:hypothetical protein [Alphaproteobacteria bacterium]
MSLSQKEATALAGFSNVVLIDRSNLPCEDAFSFSRTGTVAAFSPTQLNERLQYILKLPGVADIWEKTSPKGKSIIETDLRRASGWAYSYGVNASWSQQTIDFGREIFGEWFNLYPAGAMRCFGAIVAADSPYVKNVLQTESGLNFKLKRPNPDLDKRHELSHLRFAYTTAQKQDPNVNYFNEALADGAAARTHLDVKCPDDERKTRAMEIQEWIHMRRIDAFFNLAPSCSWTGAATEATMNRTKIPNWSENACAIRGLQIRVLDTALAKSQREINSKNYSKNEYINIAYYHGPLDKNKIADMDTYIPEIRRMIPPEKLMDSLARVLETHNLDKPTLREGEKIIEAYDYFRPQTGWRRATDPGFDF